MLFYKLLARLKFTTFLYKAFLLIRHYLLFSLIRIEGSKSYIDMFLRRSIVLERADLINLMLSEGTVSHLLY